MSEKILELPGPGRYKLPIDVGNFHYTRGAKIGVPKSFPHTRLSFMFCIIPELMRDTRILSKFI
jgi:hypothetical protein